MSFQIPFFGSRRSANRGFAPGGGEDVRKLPPLGHDGPKTLMCIMAHPDDIDFGSAGSVARWCSEGWTVYYVLATSGDKGTHGDMTPQELAATREEEQRAAARALGVKEVIFLGYPDGFLYPTAELRGDVVRLFRIYKPDVVLAWDGFRTSFNHNDHRNIGIAVRDAVFPAVRDHLYYPEHREEGLDAYRVNEMLLVGSDKPDYFVDVTNFIEQKVDAILAHASQVQTHDRDEMLKTMRSRGRRGGKIYESFKRVRIGRPLTPQQIAERQQREEQRAEETGAVEANGATEAAPQPETMPAPPDEAVETPAGATSSSP
ncbi:MAG TPA: PIG-L deacetylase family protein [Dehalococcoidia bacterium]|nr:PIG-L deacetylase family protein [Dehalococcoidia bacterium]